MKHLTLVILLALAPLSWGEDVWYCSDERLAKFEPADSGSAYKLQEYKPGRFTLEYEAGEHRLAIKGESWAGDELFYLDCEICYPEQPFFNAAGSTDRFRMKENSRFFLHPLPLQQRS